MTATSAVAAISSLHMIDVCERDRDLREAKYRQAERGVGAVERTITIQF